MNFSELLRKRRWLSKDAATRRDAVAHDGDPELVASLGSLARDDADAGVRIAAMRRLADPGIAQGLARDDPDPAVRAQARALWFDLLAGIHADAPALSERLRLLRAQDGHELMEHLLRHGREPELRRAALDRVSRPALLCERALEDSDPQIRLMLVDRLDDEAQLARLAERARKSDKRVSRRARERIETLRLARGDESTLEWSARTLCEQLEQLVREPRNDDTENSILVRWHALDSIVPATLRVRFERARNLLARSRGDLPRPSETAAAGADPVSAAAEGAAPAVVAVTASDEDEAEEAPAAKAAIEAVVVPLLAQARMASSIDEVNADALRQRAHQQDLLAQLAEALTAVEAGIEAGASVQAHAAKARADALRARIGGHLPRALARRHAAVEKRHGEISRWQHWADNKRRRQLCEDIEALPGSALHPDAVASSVRDAQSEWTRLDALEARTAARPDGLSRRFHAACRAALAPAQAYFRKRHELRQSHSEQVAALLERVSALPAEYEEWSAIVALRREVVDALRGLDKVPPRERKSLAQRLKDALRDLDTRIAHRDTRIENAKRALIAEAETLGSGELRRGAVAAARELQQRWQHIGNGRRSRDQAQWKMFRAAIDAVFGKLDAERSERSARDADAHAQAQSLCAELESLLESQTPAERGTLVRLQSSWDALGIRDSTLEQRFIEARTRLRESARDIERRRRIGRFLGWLERYRLCRAAESSGAAADDLRARWMAVTPSDIARDALGARFESALTDAQPRSDTADAFRDVLLELELLGGIEPVDEDRERRRSLQVKRLSARLRGDASAAVATEFADLLTRWTALGPAPDASLDARLERCVANIIETLP